METISTPSNKGKRESKSRTSKLPGLTNRYVWIEWTETPNDESSWKFLNLPENAFYACLPGLPLYRVGDTPSPQRFPVKSGYEPWENIQYSRRFKASTGIVGISRMDPNLEEP